MRANASWRPARSRPRPAAVPAVLAALVLCLWAPPGAAAAGAEECVPEIAPDTGEGADRLLTLVREERAAGGDAARVDRLLAEVACLTPADAPRERGTVPPADGLTVAPPEVYSLGEVAGRERWLALTEWEWSTLPDHPMTGDQAVATWFDVPVTPVLQVVHHSGATDAFPNVSREDAADVNGYGVGFLIAPERNAEDMNVALGSVALVFETESCTPLTARGAFAHAWNDTGVDALSVTATGVSYTWNAPVDRALNESGPTGVTVCP
ncbi:hypothetical protein SAMN06297387_11135 [Streptomyces zhaozhouensis]|uniref:Uncharacterized protein n=1 Tax=Streptomyces zhaozhouensis TaxID=1300267 RepID=A0A286DXU4_9ACTN|nr:hypothetical protein [Streptomyces zhaozhouensis]SOD63488.1 hypothetical protein SAMN06297387_11135 [Streptomyces zhaozhouensis]